MFEYKGFSVCIYMPFRVIHHEKGDIVKKSLEVATGYGEIPEEQQALENGIRVLAKIVVRAFTKELSELENRPLYRESNHVRLTTGSEER